jgi:hypothetical protein
MQLTECVDIWVIAKNPTKHGRTASAIPNDEDNPSIRHW